MPSMIYKKREIFGQDPSKYPARMGQRWNKDEVIKLVTSIGNNKSIKEIAKEHQRTVQSIKFYIKKLIADCSINDIQSIKEIQKNTRSIYVYTLNLEGDKKYVGYTTNLKKRFTQHFSGNGAKWTQKYRPISVNNIIRVPTVVCAKKLETFVYYKIKKHYGASNVRGAGYTKSY